MPGSEPSVPSGHYINLDGAESRRASIERALAEARMSGLVARFPALRGDGRPSKITQGELGCLLSHARLVSDAAAAGEPRLILEDDALPSPVFQPALAGALQALDEDWDILFLNHLSDFANPRRLRELLALKRDSGDIHVGSPQGKFRLLDGRQWYFAGTAAYVVSARGARRLEEVFRVQSEAGYPSPVDLLYRRLIQERRISAKVLFPYIVGIATGHESTIGARQSASPEHAALGFGIETLLNLMVAGVGRDRMLAEAHQALHDPGFDPDAFILSQAMYRYLALRKD